MTVEVLPIGTRCNLSCAICYQSPIREAGNQSNGNYDMEAMKKALAEENQPFTVFGGEPLLMPIDDLEELWRWGFERYGVNSVQTSGTLVTDRHFELFRKYKVSIGISLEGPGELNNIRWAGSIERTRKATEEALKVLRRLLEEKYSVSLITTLHRGNASQDRLPMLLDWYQDLDRRGLQHVNLHLLEIENENVRREWALSEEENANALIGCAELQSDLEHIRFQPITDMVSLLLGEDGNTNCVWNCCDPFTTRAVRGIDGHGHKINCSRTNKAGVDMQKADRELLVRAIALYHAPQDHGGCRGCRFWFACGGHCPGEAINRDWRLKTEHCGTLQRVFGVLERRLAGLGFKPISTNEDRVKYVEKRLLEAFAKGMPLRVEDACIDPGAEIANHANRAHRDQEHGDKEHGDHSDSIHPIVSHGDSDAK